MKIVVFLLTAFITSITLYGQDYATYLSPTPPPIQFKLLQINLLTNQLR